jgi:hypothetical protein
MSTETTDSDDILINSDHPNASRAAVEPWRIILWVGLAGVAMSLAFAAWIGVASAIRESRRSQCSEHLKRVGVALHEYHEAHRQFPAPAIVAIDRTKLLSWRVTILPYLGYQSLYNRFHLDEPWDSPHNLSLLAEMPHEYGCPAGPARASGETAYLVVVGPEMDAYSVNTAFAPTRGAGLHHITDGSSGSILVLETDRTAPWTKPDDLEWSRGEPLPHVSSAHTGGSHALFADAYVKFIKSNISPETLANLLTINGGEVIGGG